MPRGLSEPGKFKTNGSNADEKRMTSRSAVKTFGMALLIRSVQIKF